ncbi:MAG: trypsin-like peptidase domain-containing protein [Planctomycetota bacterium]
MRVVLLISVIMIVNKAMDCRADEGAAGINADFLAAKAFHNAARSVVPSIVTIETYGGVSTGARRGRISGVSKPGVGPTTGLIISEQGHILTSSFNFRDKPPVITVILRSGEKHVASMLGRDEKRRICLLKIDGQSDLPVPRKIDVSELRIGQWAVAVGVGYGDFEPAVSAGIVSALDRLKVGAVQTDANISPANYGGPLLSIDGRVIGICVPLHPTGKSETSGSEWYDSGIGFAVPIKNWSECIKKLTK